MKKKLLTTILKVQKEITVFFNPPAQNTVIRPMAEAVCIVHGGESVQYIDTANHKEKSISLSDLQGLKLQSGIDEEHQSFDGYQMALKAKQTPVRICVNVNDVQVFVSRKTTVKQAMADFYRKIASHQYE